MAYLGNPPKYVNFPSYSNTGDGSTTDYTLTWTPGSANAILVVLGGVVQRPQTDFTVSGDIITFETAPVNGVTFTVYALGMSATPSVPVDASVTAAKIANGAVEGAMVTPSAFRNRIINGAFDVWQRATSYSPLVLGNYPADRFQELHSVGGLSSTKSSDVPSVPGVASSLKLTVTTAVPSPTPGNYCVLWQKIEGLNCIGLGFGNSETRYVTLSFSVKSNVIGKYYVSFRNGASDRMYMTSTTINTADTWERKVITIPVDNTGTWLTDTGIGLTVTFLLMTSETPSGTMDSWGTGSVPSDQVNFLSAVNNYINFAAIQLEAGSVATPFEHRPYGTELALCKRYYQLVFLAQRFYSAGALAVASCPVTFPVEMRAAPTLSQVTVYSTVNVSAVAYNVTSTSVDRLGFGWQLQAAAAADAYRFQLTSAAAEL